MLGNHLPDPNVVTKKFWNSLTPEQQRTLHDARNQYQGALPLNISGLDGNWENKGEAIAHNLAGATGNIDYRGTGSNLHRQAIYDRNGNLVSTPENMGTYDFASPNSSSGVRDHLPVDVQPWTEWGNSSNDTTKATKN